MKFLATILIITFTIGLVIAQAPQAIPFQATARNANGVLLPNKTVSLRFTIHDATSFGATVYQETQTATTNSQGMFIVNIGQGTVVGGVFANINWSVNSKFIQIEMDTTNTGKVYRDIGTQQMLSVPYALNARKADSAILAGNGVPVGSVQAYMGTTPPVGWLLCDGTTFSRTTYANLFAILGTASGIGDGSTTFNVPDMRGVFLRGVTGSTVNDPDAASRTSNSGSGNTGNNIGSYEADAFQGHLHSTAAPATNIGGGTMYVQTIWTFTNGSGSPIGEPIEGAYGSPRFTTETRPKNVYVNYIIKY